MPAEPATCKVGRGPPLGRPTSQVAGAAGAPAGGARDFSGGLFFGPFLRSIGRVQNACFSVHSAIVSKTFFSKFTLPYQIENRSYEFVQNLAGFCDFPRGPHASRWMTNLLGFRMNSPTVLMTRCSNFTLPYHLESRSYESVQNLSGFCDFLQGLHAASWMTNLLGFRVSSPIVLLTRSSNFTFPYNLEMTLRLLLSAWPPVAVAGPRCSL